MHRRTLLLFAATFAAACSPANVGGVDAGPSADQACADWSYARCSRLQSCSPTAVELRYGDVTTCEALMKTNCVANLAAPSTGSTTAGLEECVQAVPNWDCGDFIFSQNPPPECQQATGALAAGAQCAFQAQCQSGFCAIVPGAACGACAAAPQPGDPCAQLTSCGPTLQCNTVSATCLTVAQAMAECAPDQSCAIGNECIGDNLMTGASGTCEPAGESVGAPCHSTPDDAGAATECDFYAGLTCDNQSQKCAPVQFVGAGQPCNYVESQSQSIYCGSGGKCLSATPGAQGTCAGASPLGGACDLVMGPECVSPSRCIVGAEGGTSGTCQVTDATACP
jgi:hypothetical protein